MFSEFIKTGVALLIINSIFSGISYVENTFSGEQALSQNYMSIYVNNYLLKTIKVTLISVPLTFLVLIITGDVSISIVFGLASSFVFWKYKLK